MDNIIYKGLGHKLAFKKWSLIVHYKSGQCDIISIPKKAYDVLLKLGYAEEV